MALSDQKDQARLLLGPLLRTVIDAPCTYNLVKKRGFLEGAEELPIVYVIGIRTGRYTGLQTFSFCGFSETFLIVKWIKCGSSVLIPLSSSCKQPVMQDKQNFCHFGDQTLMSLWFRLTLSSMWEVRRKLRGSQTHFGGAQQKVERQWSQVTARIIQLWCKVESPRNEDGPTQ